MSVIAPGTTIYLLKDVPLDDTFDHTLYWENTAQGKADQLDWFIGQTNGFVERKLENYTYQRIEKGSCMVEAVADDIYGCNYMVFQNSPQYGSKWWFCFIQDVEYINNKTSRLTLKIDVMQTFYFDYELIPCYVERQHPETDIFGEHIQDEGIEYGGEYWYDHIVDVNLGENYIVVCGTVRPVAGVTHEFTIADIEDVGGGGMYNGIYSGVVFNVFRYPVTVNEFLDAVTEAGKEPGIVNIFMAPEKFFDEAHKPIDYYREDDRYLDPAEFTGLWGTFGYSAGTVKVEPTEFTVRGINIPSTVGSYTPRNKKLLCYPYSVLAVTNNNGKSAQYRYEFFTTETVVPFQCVLALSSTPEACVYPKNYKRVEYNYLEKLVIDDYPQCAYSIDSYKAWLAQHRYTLSMGFSSDIMNAGVAFGTGALGLASAPGLFNSVFGKMAQIKQASILPPHVKGEQTGTTMMAIKKQGFHFYNARITDYYAELIDQYFSRFGYVCNRIRVPNRNSRKHFNFCKTRNCDINPSNMPDKYVKEIKEIYDNGITFWSDHNKNNIGKYTVEMFDDNQAPHGLTGGE